MKICGFWTNIHNNNQKQKESANSQMWWGPIISTNNKFRMFQKWENKESIHNVQPKLLHYHFDWTPFGYIFLFHLLFISVEFCISKIAVSFEPVCVDKLAEISLLYRMVCDFLGFYHLLTEIDVFHEHHNHTCERGTKKNGFSRRKILKNWTDSEEIFYE